MTLNPGTTYQPKHLKHYRASMSHCCFSGCTPMGCPGGCCIMEMGHRADCPSNPFRQFDEAEHEAYIAAGLQKHLFDPHSPIPQTERRRRTRI